MSRVAMKPITIPAGVEVKENNGTVTVKGSKGSLTLTLHREVQFKQSDADMSVSPKESDGMAITGTMRSLLNNMVIGVSNGYEKKLQLVGIGYRAQAQGRKLSLTLGFSHPVEYHPPEGIDIEVPSATEIIIKGVDKQSVGQVAADIRAFRPPEPYKGKGVKYAGERIVRKEAKKA